MKVLALDVETSDLPRWDLPSHHILQPHICSIGWVLFDPASNESIEVYELVKPADWGISAEAQRVHGLSVEYLTERGRPIREVMERFLVGYELCDQIAGYNIVFDLKMLRGALRRCGLPDRRNERPELCCMQAVRPHLNIAPNYKMMAAGRRTSKTPKLIEAYELLLGKPMAGAHNALEDAKAVVELYRWLLAGNKLPLARIRA
jgi:DNA polymerase III subunit epsilon